MSKSTDNIDKKFEEFIKSIGFYEKDKLLVIKENDSQGLNKDDLEIFFKEVICNESSNYTDVIESNKKIIEKILKEVETLRKMEKKSNDLNNIDKIYNKLILCIVDKCIDMHNRKYGENGKVINNYSKINNLKHCVDLIKLFGEFNVFNNYKKSILFGIKKTEYDLYIGELGKLCSNTQCLYALDNFSKQSSDELKNLITDKNIDATIRVNLLSTIMNNNTDHYKSDFIDQFESNELNELKNLIIDESIDATIRADLFLKVITIEPFAFRDNFINQFESNELKNLIIDKSIDATIRVNLFSTIMNTGIINFYKEDFLDQFESNELNELKNLITDDKNNTNINKKLTSYIEKKQEKEQEIAKQEEKIEQQPISKPIQTTNHEERQTLINSSNKVTANQGQKKVKFHKKVSQPQKPMGHSI